MFWKILSRRVYYSHHIIQVYWIEYVLSHCVPVSFFFNSASLFVSYLNLRLMVILLIEGVCYRMQEQKWIHVTVVKYKKQKVVEIFWVIPQNWFLQDERQIAYTYSWERDHPIYAKFSWPKMTMLVYIYGILMSNTHYNNIKKLQNIRINGIYKNSWCNFSLMANRRKK